ncbi:porin [Chitinimonas sp. BJYL2]|uniref:porin n=1 Tax=Chitinimonas sp. BJYL2 TaxID=2976696 RepID=UPI0022B4A605|nr:porin [Chitinimonas sp. BJYL2]
MNKQLIALAVLGAISAPAFANDSSVTLYGRIEMGLEFYNNGDATDGSKGISAQRVEGYASRIGFKGEEKLGDGLSALWQVEQKVNVDSGSGTTFADRNSFVGLKGEFGTLLLGRHDTPFKALNKYVDIMWGNAEQHEIINNGKAAGMSLHTRRNNAIHYVSPKFSNMVIRAQFSPDEEKTSTTNKNLFSFSGEYDDGTYFLGAAYEGQRDAVATGQDRKGYKLNGGVKLGDTTLGANYSTIENENTKESDNWSFAVSHKMGNTTLKGIYGISKVDDLKAPTKQLDVSMYGLEVDYSLSKRTAVYGLFTQIRNDRDAAAKFENSTSPNTPVVKAGGDPRIISFGVRHSF